MLEPHGRDWAGPPTEALFAMRQREGQIGLPGPGVRLARAASASAAAATSSTSQRSEKPRPRKSARPAAQSAEPGQPAAARIGVISDNHGYLDPRVLELFAGVVHIIHAGDVVDPDILAALETIAPVTAVSGNMDSGDLASRLPRAVGGEVAGVRFVVGHKRKRLLRDVAAGKIAGLAYDAAPDLVVYGHDHVPAAAWVDGTLYLDPGSASSPHEEDDGPTVAIVEVTPSGLAVTFLPLERRDLSEGKELPTA